MMSADKHIVNIWDASTAQNLTSLQPQEPGINDVLHWKGSGLIMLGLDSPRIQVVPLPGHRILIITGSRFYSILPSTCFTLSEQAEIAFTAQGIRSQACDSQGHRLILRTPETACTVERLQLNKAIKCIGSVSILKAAAACAGLFCAIAGACAPVVQLPGGPYGRAGGECCACAVR